MANSKKFISGALIGSLVLQSGVALAASPPPKPQPQPNPTHSAPPAPAPTPTMPPQQVADLGNARNVGEQAGREEADRYIREHAREATIRYNVALGLSQGVQRYSDAGIRSADDSTYSSSYSSVANDTSATSPQAVGKSDGANAASQQASADVGVYLKNVEQSAMDAGSAPNFAAAQPANPAFSAPSFSNPGSAPAVTPLSSYVSSISGPLSQAVGVNVDAARLFNTNPSSILTPKLGNTDALFNEAMGSDRALGSMESDLNSKDSYGRDKYSNAGDAQNAVRAGFDDAVTYSINANWANTVGREDLNMQSTAYSMLVSAVTPYEAQLGAYDAYVSVYASNAVASFSSAYPVQYALQYPIQVNNIKNSAQIVGVNVAAAQAAPVTIGDPLTFAASFENLGGESDSLIVTIQAPVSGALYAISNGSQSLSVAGFSEVKSQAVGTQVAAAGLTKPDAQIVVPLTAVHDGQTNSFNVTFQATFETLLTRLATSNLSSSVSASLTALLQSTLAAEWTSDGSGDFDIDNLSHKLGGDPSGASSLYIRRLSTAVKAMSAAQQATFKTNASAAIKAAYPKSEPGCTAFIFCGGKNSYEAVQKELSGAGLGGILP
jgi:hypothetical protein